MALAWLGQERRLPRREVEPIELCRLVAAGRALEHDVVAARGLLARRPHRIAKSVSCSGSASGVATRKIWVVSAPALRVAISISARSGCQSTKRWPRKSV